MSRCLLLDPLRLTPSLSRPGNPSTIDAASSMSNEFYPHPYSLGLAEHTMTPGWSGASPGLLHINLLLHSFLTCKLPVQSGTLLCSALLASSSSFGCKLHPIYPAGAIQFCPSASCFGSLSHLGAEVSLVYYLLLSV